MLLSLRGKTTVPSPEFDDGRSFRIWVMPNSASASAGTHVSRHRRYTIAGLRMLQEIYLVAWLLT